MIYTWKCDRRQFVDLLSNKKITNNIDIRKSDELEEHFLQHNDILLVWRNLPESTFYLPQAVVVAKESVNDFLAWSSTYLRSIRPFTAHCRVLTSAMANIAVQPCPPTLLPDIKAVDIGLILTEGIAHSFGKTDVDRLPISAFSRTLSFAYANGLRKYDRLFIDNPNIANQITEEWLSVRELTNQAHVDLLADEIKYVWEIVLCVISGSNNEFAKSSAEYLIYKSLQGVINSIVAPIGLWLQLPAASNGVEIAFESLEGPRENRVRAIEKAIQDLSKGTASTKKIRAFLAGYLASRIQPGTLDHISLLVPTMSEIPESILWFGVCAGLDPKTSIQNYGNGLGFLIARELGRTSNWLDYPECDIALSELKILLQSRDNAKLNIRTLSSGALKVEIFPLITTSIKWSESNKSQNVTSRSYQNEQLEKFKEDHKIKEDVSNLLQQIQECSKSLTAIRKNVEIKFGKQSSTKRKQKSK